MKIKLIKQRIRKWPIGHIKSFSWTCSFFSKVDCFGNGVGGGEGVWNHNVDLCNWPTFYPVSQVSSLCLNYKINLGLSHSLKYNLFYWVKENKEFPKKKIPIS